MNEALFSDAVKRNLDGIEAEKAGDISKAIALYEMNIALRFEGNHPYDRLAVIYHKQKKYDDEERVLLTAIDVFTNDVYKERSDRLPKLEKFTKRLDKLRSTKNA